MRFSRVRAGERLAVAAAVALALLLGLNWFFLSAPEAMVGQHESGIRSVGWFAALLLVAAILCALALGFFTLTQRATALPVIFSVLTFVVGLLAALAVLVRLTIWQPTLGVGVSSEDVDVELWGILGFFAAAAISAGGWVAMADERTDSAEAIEQTEEVLRLRGDNPRKPPPLRPGGPYGLAGSASASAGPANP